MVMAVLLVVTLKQIEKHPTTYGHGDLRIDSSNPLERC